MQEVLDFLKKCGTYYLATVDAGQPRMRPFGTADIWNGRLTVQTGKKKAVSKQIHADPHVAICAFDGQQWLRIEGTAVEVPDIAAQNHMLDAYPALRRMYAEGDGNTEIFAVSGTAVFCSFTEPPRVIVLP